MSIYEDLKDKREKISIIGLGYVGIPLAIAFAKKFQVIGFDTNSEKILLYSNGIDPTGEVDKADIKNTTIEFTDDERKIKNAKFHIIAVPTPIKSDKSPDLFPVINASEIVGRNLMDGSIVVYESTVYPGVTEDVCIPILEKESNLKCGKNFFVGYSPERINPGDKVHRLETIKKIVSGMNEEVLEEIANIYGMIIKAGVHKVSSIKIAEAAKVVENSQRDINIAFMNELAMAFDKMDIDTSEVITAMNTKWNALSFYPGLVGGHCIGVDPYYFIYKAEKLGYHSQIIASGRKINDGMGEFIAHVIIKQLILANKVVKEAKVAILGITFKENCPDIRNSKVMDIIKVLQEYEILPIVIDPMANKDEVEREYGIHLSSDVKECDCLVFAVAHDEFKNYTWDEIAKCFNPSNDKPIIIDIKSIINKIEAKKRGFGYWSL